jgi:pyrroloquinoline quinone (PQQ) biosynthesis protein C
MLAKTFFHEIESQSASCRDELAQTAIIQSCLGGQVSRESYIAFLTEAYYHVKHTVPLLMASGSRLPDRLEWLRVAIVHYINEELGHQEWILNDLAALGVDKNPVRDGQALAATEVMIAYAYDSVLRKNPLCLFAMVYVLEKTSSTIATLAAQSIRSNLELPDTAMSYLHTHGSLDQEHLGDFETLMNRLDNDEDRNAVLHCVPIFYELYRGIFESLPLPSTTPGVTS